MGCCFSHEEPAIVPVATPNTLQVTLSPCENTTPAPLPSAPWLSEQDLYQLYAQSFREVENYSPEQNPTDPQ
jgi:hypothetical protein